MPAALVNSVRSSALDRFEAASTFSVGQQQLGASHFYRH
ncbi:hypothetical protein BTZ20_0687 [Rhodococcus sp. MTM3W5.2]|nr:hypothetical protein BTZ20_0687 [Rhodococcus sp. MTM3W5.2]